MMTEQKPATLNCPVCRNDFQQKYRYREEKYCSKACWSERGSYRNKICAGCGKVGIAKRGKKYCTRECAHKQIKEKASAFKENAGYSAIHKWINAHFGKPVKCICCGLKGKKMHWANIDHKYSRERDDWVELCAKCHAWFDRGDPHYCDVIIKRWEDFTGEKAVKIGAR